MKTHQIVYMIESNRTVRPVEIIKLVGNFAVVKFESGGGIQIPIKRLYRTLEEAQKAIPNQTEESRISYDIRRINSRKYNAQML